MGKILNSRLVEDKNLVIFGTGSSATKVIQDLKEQVDCNILYCVDNNPEMWGREFEGYEIKSPSALFCNEEGGYEHRLVLICSMYHRQIGKQLTEAGLMKGRDFIASEALYLPHKLPVQIEFERLIGKYGFDDGPCEFAMVDDIKEIILDLPENWRIAIWGAGEHTLHLMNLIDFRSRIAFIVDSDSSKWGTSLNGIPITSPETIREGHVQAVLISSRKHRNQIKKSISENFPAVKAIDPYETFDDVVISEDTFYSFPGTYRDFVNPVMLRHKLESASDVGKKAVLLKLYLEQLLHIKEFALFDEAIRTYCDPAMPEAENWVRLNDELKQFLRNIHETVRSRQQDDIVWFIVDSLRWIDVGQCCYLSTLSDSGISFQNAYSPSTHTRASYIGMFSHEPLTMKLLKTKSVDALGSNLFEWLSNNGYRIVQNGGPSILNVPKMEYVYTDNKDWHPFTFRWWETLCRLYTYNEPQFHILHAFELHQPYFSVNQKKLNLLYHPLHYFRDHPPDMTGSTQQHAEALAYLDRQLSQASAILPEKSTVVISADHGTGVGGHHPIGHMFGYSEEHIHVPLIIRRPGVQARKLDGLFSFTKIQPMLLHVFTEGDVDPSLLDGHVVVLREAVYNPLYVNNKELCKNAGELMEEFAVVIAKGFKYVRLARSEKLFRLPDEDTNLAELPEYRDVLHELKGLLMAG